MKPKKKTKAISEITEKQPLIPDSPLEQFGEGNSHLNLVEKYITRQGDFPEEQIPNSFFHTGSIGDVWASLPCVMETCRKIKKKAIYYLRQDVEAIYYDGAVHPTLDNKTGKQVGLNEEMIKMMIPLLKAQPYIEDAKFHTNEKVRVPLNVIRYTFVNMPYHSLAKWYFYVYPDSFCDLSKQYIFAPPTNRNFARGKLVIARTERYLNSEIEYSFLKKYEKYLVFSGTELEHIIFCARFKLNIPRLKVKNFLELAQAIQQSLGTLTNQTMLAQISEGMKIPRAVELCKMAPNVDFTGPNGFEFYNQRAIENWVAELFQKKYPIKRVLKSFLEFG